ncbi:MULTISPECIES: response regulator [unclassified Roseitalea]|uniref:response regulator transcription factor n=1 Tax=unclassified Roseitalea TaxID=2639107 RepID=UPI00273D75FE|nr:MULTISPECIES: response regulator [unclassified Roseitalea]
MTARILVAEDEPFIMESLSFLLRREGYELTAVPNGTRVLDRVQAELPDLVILDAMLPGKDGFAILEDLRRADFGQTLPVLVLTAKGQEADRNRMMALGADAFVTKPFSNQQLLAEIARLLSARNAQGSAKGKPNHGP